jgi:molybdopterin synthase catalytic subunit
MSPRVRTALSSEPLDVQAAVDEVTDPAGGGIGLFVGTVRESAASKDINKPVIRLEYEAHESLAGSRLEEIAMDACRKWEVLRLVALHRTGTCELGEPTVVVACSAPHRADALDACRYVIDTIKQTVPIFKKEVYDDGSSWIGAEGSL